MARRQFSIISWSQSVNWCMTCSPTVILACNFAWSSWPALPSSISRSWLQLYSDWVKGNRASKAAIMVIPAASHRASTSGPGIEPHVCGSATILRQRLVAVLDLVIEGFQARLGRPPPLPESEHGEPDPVRFRRARLRLGQIAAGELGSHLLGGKRALAQGLQPGAVQLDAESAQLLQQLPVAEPLGIVAVGAGAARTRWARPLPCPAFNGDPRDLHRRTTSSRNHAWATGQRTDPMGSGSRCASLILLGPGGDRVQNPPLRSGTPGPSAGPRCTQDGSRRHGRQGRHAEGTPSTSWTCR